MSLIPNTQRTPSVWLLVFATATGPLALNMFVPSMPGLPAVFDTDTATAQLTLTLFLVGLAVGQLLYGPLSDRLGRRPVLLGGVTLYVAAGIVCALAPTIETLIVGRVMQALGGCAGMVIGRAVVRDAWTREEATRVLALVIAGMAVAPMVGPVLGGLLDVFVGWRTIFVALTLFGGVTLAAGLRLLPETHWNRVPMPGPLALGRTYGALLGNTAFLGYALSVAFLSAGFFCFLAGAPYIMAEKLGGTPAEYGLLFVILSATYMAGNMLVSRLAARVAPDRLVVAGLALSAATPVILLAILWTGTLTPLGLFLPTALLTFGNGLALPPAITVAVGLEPRLAGTASGLVGFMQMGLGSLASIVIGAAGAAEPMVTAVGMLLCNLASVAAFALACACRGQSV